MPGVRSELDTIRALYRYNSRVRKKYLSVIWRLPIKQRYRSRGASYPSLVDIFLHVLDAYRWWFHTVYSHDAAWIEYPIGQRLTRGQAMAEERKLDRFVQGVIAKIDHKDLSRTFTLPSNRRRRISLRVLLLHMAEEELQHRGEMNALLWQSDVDPPITGF
ncbi:MAG: DinB family protein [Thermoplasmata archaeon]|nr:DinB family protein [Thermoplasmata archaeon]